MSLNGLRDVLFNVDTLQTEGANVQSLTSPSLLVKGGLHGTLVAYEIQGSQASSALAYEQETWVNSATNKVWVLMAGCSPSCFQSQQPVISRIMQSFLVTDRGSHDINRPRAKGQPSPGEPEDAAPGQPAATAAMPGTGAEQSRYQ